MQTFKRIFLFIALNFLICITVLALFTVLGLNGYLHRHHISTESLFLVCLVYGMTGAFISLMLSKVIAKWTMGLKMITIYDCSQEGVFLKRVVEKLAKKAGLAKIPEIGIFTSPTPNAFATGPTASRSLVAVSTGLLQKLDKEEIEAVIGHEIAHIKNGDMVTMTLLQGVVNTFVIFLSYIIAQAISMNAKKERSQGTFYLSRFVLQTIFMILGSIIVATFSRAREYRADLGGAHLTSPNHMIRALQRLEESSKKTLDQETPQSVAALMCNGKMGFLELFSTHPPISKRVAALKKLEESPIV
ncbi:MAG: protease HtpX [Chlamydiia bacterium]